MIFLYKWALVIVFDFYTSPLQFRRDRLFNSDSRGIPHSMLLFCLLHGDTGSLIWHGLFMEPKVWTDQDGNIARLRCARGDITSPIIQEELVSSKPFAVWYSLSLWLLTLKGYYTWSVINIAFVLGIATLPIIFVILLTILCNEMKSAWLWCNTSFFLLFFFFPGAFGIKRCECFDIMRGNM